MKKLLMPCLILFCATLCRSRFTPLSQDTVYAVECENPPVIDGLENDPCWTVARWYNIDNVWIPYGTDIDSSDFYGRFKVCWSPQTNLVTFLVDIVDDVLVDGYAYPMDGYYNWDVVEIFFDEDASGGDHQLNQNAFAYHITAGNQQTEFEVMDLAAGWQVVNYSDHFDCKIAESEGHYLWEISMKVYDENYDPQKSNNPTLELEPGKVSGLSLAYCDNDDPDESPKTRDHFIGSVHVPANHYNDHWMNADWFGTMKLLSATETGLQYGENDFSFRLLENYPNPFNPTTHIEFELGVGSTVKINIYNARGERICTLFDGYRERGNHRLSWSGINAKGIPVGSGIYFYELIAATPNQVFSQTKKMTVMR